MTRGIDVSNNNTSADWDGVAFAYRKATEGVSFVDKTQARWHAEAQAHGVPDGPYHFAHPDQNSADDEAEYFLAHAIPGQFWALDCETREANGKPINPLAVMGAAALTAWCDRFYEIVAPVLGAGGFHYTFRSYADALWPRLASPWRWWLASAYGSPHFRTYAGRTVHVEQYAIVGGVDQNEAYVDLVAPAKQQEDDMPPAPAVAILGGRRRAYCRGVDGQLYEKVDNAAKWTPLGGSLLDGPSVCVDARNVLHVFVRGTKNDLWHRYLENDKWSAWRAEGGAGIITSAPDCFASGDDHGGRVIAVVARGAGEGAVWINTFAGEKWSGWNTLGGLT